MKYLMEHEQKYLLKILRDSKSAMRDKTIIELVFNTGLRIQELRLLNVGDIWNGCTIRDHLVVRAETAKRCKTREIYINSHIRKVLKGFILWKRTKGETLDLEAALFISKKFNRVGQRTIQDMIEKWFILSGFIDAKGKSQYTFHSLRHSFAMNLRQRSVSLERIQKLLGHASLQATGVYLEPSREELAETVELLSVA